MLNVLFLCTGNSCRSILAEAYLNHIGKGHFQVFSAGSQPTGQINPKSLETLQRHGIGAEGFRSKSWDELKDTHFDLVVTVCDSAAGESCPIFPGAPLKVHWGVPDPAHFKGTQEQIDVEFERVFSMLRAPIDQLAALPVERMQKYELTQKVKAIGIAEHDTGITAQRI